MANGKLSLVKVFCVDLRKAFAFAIMTDERIMDELWDSVAILNVIKNNTHFHEWRSSEKAERGVRDGKPMDHKRILKKTRYKELDHIVRQTKINISNK